MRRTVGRRRPPAPIPQRGSRGLPIRRTILIVGEGQKTEPIYFDGLKREDAVAARFTITVKRGPGISPERVVEEAVKFKKQAADRSQDYDEVWCVMDTEGTEKRESLAKALRMAREHDIQVCLSNPAFEVWLLSHFERSAGFFLDGRGVIVKLNKHWQENFSVEYNKADDHLYRRIAGSTLTAIANAQWAREIHHREKKDMVDCNSSTQVYLLVKKLLAA